MSARDQVPSRTALYPGSFDPIHLGHVDVVEQAIELFGGIVIAALHNPTKSGGDFSIEQRVRLIQASTSHIPNVRVESFVGLAIDAARAFGADFIVKGLRNSGDFEIEQQMAHTNFSASGVRTVYVPCRPDLAFISSRFIREIAHYGGVIGHMVPKPVAQALTSADSPKAHT
jgi:pantetheine-phosphate adenylyltransferase